MATVRVQRVVTVVAAFVLIVAVLAFGRAHSVGVSGADQPVRFSITVPMDVMQPEWQPIGWPEVDYLMENRLQIIGLLELGQAPGVSDWTNDYYLSLNERKAHAMAFAEEAHPEIVFIGVLHDPPNERAGADVYELVDAVQTDALAQLKATVGPDTVIMLESTPGCNEPFTKDSYNALGDEFLKRFADAGLPIGTDTLRPFAEDRMRNDVFGEAVLIKPPQAYCGEEWPMVVGIGVLLRKQELLRTSVELYGTPNGQIAMTPEDAVRYRLAKQASSDFISLRSEVVLIRALEMLERTGHHKAIVLMGAHHGRDFERLEDSYHVELTTWYPTGYKERDTDG